MVIEEINQENEDNGSDIEEDEDIEIPEEINKFLD
jgi:hypothetical protein